MNKPCFDNYYVDLHGLRVLLRKISDMKEKLEADSIASVDALNEHLTDLIDELQIALDGNTDIDTKQQALIETLSGSVEKLTDTVSKLPAGAFVMNGLSWMTGSEPSDSILKAIGDFDGLKEAIVAGAPIMDVHEGYSVVSVRSVASDNKVSLVFVDGSFKPKQYDITSTDGALSLEVITLGSGV